MKNLFLSLFACLALVFFTSGVKTAMAQTTPSNPDGGFEDYPLGEQDSSYTFDGWTLLQGAPDSTIFLIVDDSVHSGSHSLMVGLLSVDATSKDWDVQVVNEPIKVDTIAATYVYSVWAKADPPGAVVNFTVGVPVTYNERYRMGSAVVTDSWRRYSSTFNTVKGDTSLRAPIHFGLPANSAYAPVAFWIDDLTIAKVPVDTIAPDAPVLASPNDGAVGQNPKITLTWNTNSRPCVFHVQVATNQTFSTPQLVFNDSTVIDTTIQLSLATNTQYYWRVQAYDTKGRSSYSAAISFTTGVTGVKSLGGLPASYALSQNFPNPFNPSTTIRYSVPKNSYVRVAIYDLLGREVTSLVNGVQHASEYSVQWNPSGLSSGIYFCRIQAASMDGSGNFTSVKKLVYMK
ncbi:MAG TPA: T9SS type A sorting domain-containing protein [Candidatus Acidoferrales bacterium]|nr:T9SS type A sorting domain-containing protein [Candidatus Acidoferrales bacterium]